jgi:hypothetical protein
MRSVTWLTAVALLVAGTGPILGDDEDNQGGEGKKIFQTDLVRIADLNVPNGNPAGQQLGPLYGPNGTDPLDEGSVLVREEGRIEVSLRAAAAGQAYSVFFCRFAFAPGAGCLAFGAAGALATDSKGNGTAKLNFPQPGSTPSFWAGVFILTRSVSGTPTNEYVSGFRLRPRTKPDEAELDIAGQVSSVNAGAKSFRVGSLPQDIVTDNATKFGGGLKGFSDLAIGVGVEVKAKTGNDGRLLASEIEGKGPMGELVRSRGRRHD